MEAHLRAIVGRTRQQQGRLLRLLLLHRGQTRHGLLQPLLPLLQPLLAPLAQDRRLKKRRAALEWSPAIALLGGICLQTARPGLPHRQTHRGLSVGRAARPP